MPWTALYLAFPIHRKTMIWASAFTAPLGLTEPLFVPEYMPLEELAWAIAFGLY